MNPTQAPKTEKPSSSQIEKPQPVKENVIGRTMDWAKGLILGVFSKKPQHEVTGTDTYLEDRELEEGEGKEKTLEDRKILQAKLANSIKNPESNLKKLIEENKNNLISWTDKYFKEKQTLHQAQELSKISSFDEVIKSKNNREYELVLNKLEEAIRTNFPELDQTEFNKELFKKDALSFMVRALADNREKTDLRFVIDHLIKSDREFADAFGAIKIQAQEYFFELRKAKRDINDQEYQKANSRYNELEAFLEAIHDYNDITEWDALEKEFNETFGQEYKELESYLVEKEQQEFEKLFQELTLTLFANDKEFQKARTVIDNRVYLAGNTFNVAHLYFSDPEFREAYNVVNSRFQSVEELLGAQRHRPEGNLVSAADFAKGVVGEATGDVAQFLANNKGKMFLSPALVIGTAVFGIQAIPVAMGLSIANKARPAIYKVLIESDVLFDYKAAREDRKVRAPLLQHVFLEAPTAEQKKRALDHLISSNLLFIEDVEADAELKNYLDEQKIDLEKLPSLNKYREARLQFKSLMKEAFPNEEILKSLIIELQDAGLLYREDFKGRSDEEIMKLLPKGIKIENLKSLEDDQNLRNPSLFLLKGGVKLSVQQKLGELAKLHQKGLLFKEDIERLKKDNIASNQQIAEFLSQNKISSENLPSLQTYYYKTNVTLKQQDDLKREPFLKVLNDPTASQADKLFTLKNMHLEGICFLNDLEIEGLEDQTKTDFKNFVSMSPSERKEKHDAEKTGDAFLAKHEAILKSNASPEDKMASLLELQMEGLLEKKHKSMVDKPTLLRYNANYLEKPEHMSNKLVDAHEHYQSGVFNRFQKLNNLAYETIKQNAGKIAIGMAYAMGGDWQTIAGVAIAGDIAGVIWRKEQAVEVFQGPMRDIKNAMVAGIEVMSGVVSDFTDIPAKNIHERIVKKLPSDQKIKQNATIMLNKSIGTVKMGILGSAVGSIFGIPGLKIGATIGSFYGLMATEGKISQVPAGGIQRALKFSAIGALVGAVIPGVVAAVVGGLALAGLISATAGMAVATGGLALIIPLILFGVYAGFQIAGLTGKDVQDKTDDVMDQLGTYQPIILEQAGVYLA